MSSLLCTTQIRTANINLIFLKTSVNRVMEKAENKRKTREKTKLLETMGLGWISAQKRLKKAPRKDPGFSSLFNISGLKRECIRVASGPTICQ